MIGTAAAPKTVMMRENFTRPDSASETNRATIRLTHVLREKATRTARLRIEMEAMSSNRGNPR